MNLLKNHITVFGEAVIMIAVTVFAILAATLLMSEELAVLLPEIFAVPILTLLLDGLIRIVRR